MNPITSIISYFATESDKNSDEVGSGDKTENEDEDEDEERDIENSSIREPTAQVTEDEHYMAVVDYEKCIDDNNDEDDIEDNDDDPKNTLFPPVQLSDPNCSSLTSGVSHWTPVRKQPRPPPAHLKKYLYPVSEIIEELHPEEVRWMYRHAGKKKWTPFIGYDSLRIEFRYRELSVSSLSEDKLKDMIVVRGGLYEVDVVARKCYPLFWTGDTADVLRGIWFYDDTWQPLEEDTSIRIESDHLGKFLGKKYPCDFSETVNLKVARQVIHHIAFSDCHVEWRNATEVYMFSDSTPSKIVRSVSQTLGFQKSGTKLCRGYCNEARMDDKPPDITHLVFVVHGIGQKMDTGNIIKRCNELRESIERLKKKNFPNLDQSNQRVEFLPVEWRSSLQLDGDTVELITPHSVKGLRTILNSSAMDILYYTSPLYRSEITHGLQSEINRLYSVFCLRNPYFISAGGKISIAAHSLGAVITYDIITSWNPIKLYDQFVASLIKQYMELIDEKREQLQDSTHLLTDMDSARARVSEIESQLSSLQEKQQKGSQALKFRVENLFCLGSPLAVFLTLRGVPLHGCDNNGQPNVIPSHLCHRLFNIYHPADPIAYRIEPLIYKHYASILPVDIQRFDAPLKRPYSECSGRGSTSDTLVDSSSEHSIASIPESSTETEVESSSLPKTIGYSLGNMFLTLIKKSPSDLLTRELKKMETEARQLEEMNPTPMPSCSVHNAPGNLAAISSISSEYIDSSSVLRVLITLISNLKASFDFYFVLPQRSIN
eukprot:XP_014780930.1 PREDICTED: phospholipase DDHD1-like [Octopus bimaculoides]